MIGALMSSPKFNIAVMGSIGVVLVIIHALTSQLSHQFIFGQDDQQRPIIHFLVLMGLAGVFYIGAIEIVRRNAVLFSSPMMLGIICLLALITRLVYVPSNLIQETDPYRYIWDGQAVIQGVNPYQYSPQEAASKELEPSSNKPVVQDVYRKINHQGIRTIYPPLALLFFTIPTGNPWYYTWILLFIPFLPSRALILFSVLLFAYYLDFYFQYHQDRPAFVMVRWIEYGVFYFILGVELWFRRLPLLSRS
jgi:hypothetical protein